ncbi:heterokaryon incompatibility protein-domain-containing protein [Hypomontagnella monticulosa]|nr:heterokaryon incompatibility protein-domain-containing protein [Hypomontagnella monticulosa]
MPLLDTYKTFCAKCRNISWEDEFPEETYHCWKLDHYTSFTQLEASAEKGCHLCQNFWTTLVYEHSSASWFEGKKLHFAVEQIDGIPYAIAIDLKGPGDNETSGYRVNVGIAPRNDASEDKQLTIERFSSQDKQNALIATCNGVIRRWVDDCIAGRDSHTGCGARSLAQSKPLSTPTRLIDVGATDVDTIRIAPRDKLPQSSDLRYLILSYCWGRGNDSAKTTPANYQRRLKQIEVSDLPNTIRDAVELTRRMNIRYLWVDAICIIQRDDQSDGSGDWLDEAPRMGEYYSNALCCICASRASDSEEGFLTERRVARFGWRPMHIPQSGVLNETSDNKNGKYFRLDGLERSLTKELDEEPLMRRAWCLQEWMLSPRKLHWTKNGLFWECNGVFGMSEDKTVSPRDEDSLREARLLLELPREESLGEKWFEIVQRYSAMKLSFEKDRLAAIQGIANQLSQKHNDEYYAGLFRSSLPQSLCWCEDSDFDARPNVNHYFPTWSWACVSPSRFYQLRLRDDGSAESLLGRVEFQPSQPKDKVEDFMNPSTRLLRLEAPFMEMELIKVTDTMYNSPTWPEADIFFTPDTPQEISSPCHILWLVRNVVNSHKGENTTECVGISLKETGLNDTEAWERIGLTLIYVEPTHEVELAGWKRFVDLI